MNLHIFYALFPFAHAELQDFFSSFETYDIEALLILDSIHLLQHIYV